MFLESLSHTGVPLAVSVGNEHLNGVSNSVILAERWLRSRVLAHYPTAKITTIVVGHNVLCNRNQEHQMSLVLPSVKNIYHSLTRWGLEREIRVSASLSLDCLNPSSASYKDDLAQKYIKPLLTFLESTNSPYLVNPPNQFTSSPDETLALVSSHTESMKNLGFISPAKISVLVPSQKEESPKTRKLYFIDPEAMEAFPTRPNNLLAPTHPPTYSVPPFIANSPLPPVPDKPSPPPYLSPPIPKHSPMISPASSPSGHDLPPCKPSHAPAPTDTGVKYKLWCVAKPTVPPNTLQEAMDYACGAGGGDCEAIKPHGSCYYPDTVLAHASYAFNSYWQKNKRSGGTCTFGGTAMLINADPSFHPCQFILT
ncbi:Glucan endo-1,3-beta-D-glucosidase [Bertholletia excelsa]